MRKDSRAIGHKSQPTSSQRTEGKNLNITSTGHSKLKRLSSSSDTNYNIAGWENSCLKILCTLKKSFRDICFSNIVGNDNYQFIGDHNDEDNVEEITIAQVDTLLDSFFKF